MLRLVKGAASEEPAGERRRHPHEILHAEDGQSLVGQAHPPSLWSAVLRRGLHLGTGSDGALRTERLPFQEEAR